MGGTPYRGPPYLYYPHTRCQERIKPHTNQILNPHHSPGKDEAMPKRIQHRRYTTLMSNIKLVARATRFGNPFKDR